jgi:PAS domain S-box-containing protein
LSRPLQILIVEDDPADAALLVRALEKAGLDFEHRVVAGEEDYLRHLQDGPDVILADYALPEFGGLRALELLRDCALEIPFLIVSGTIGEDVAVAVMREGASDYLLKDRLTRLGPAVIQAIEQNRARKEKQEAMAALRESERRFRDVVQNIEEVFWMTNVAKTEVLFVSAAYEKIWGRSCESLCAAPETWLDTIYPEDRDRVHRATKEQAGGTYHEEYRIIRPDGSIRWISDRAFPVRGRDGGVHRIAGVAEDITARKQAERRVQEQAAMLDLAHDAIIVRGFRERTISFWNKGATHLYGWSSTEATGRNVGELLFTDLGKLDEIEATLLQTGEWRGESDQVSRGGKKLTVSTRATLVRDSRNEPSAVLTINTDITGQKELEARLLRAQRMESIGTLASGVAHDLNNILAPIMMSASVLRRDLTTEQREGIIAAIEMSAERGAQIVNQVLTFGRGLEGERHKLQVNDLLEELMKIVKGTFPKNITLECVAEPTIWPVQGDATQLHQVLLNLCVNARDAMPEGGRLRLLSANRDLDANYASMLPEATPGPYVLIEVTDTGTGIPAEIIEQIFVPFFTTKSVGRGTGLGLSTALGIVRSHGGFIHVDTRPGEGTTFQVWLPVSPDHRAASADSPGSPIPQGHGELVLVVDDEAGICNAARLVLETAGYRVLLAGDGSEALMRLAQNAADVSLMLTDLMMPLMDGMALIHALRTILPGLPVIASTGLGEKPNLAQLQALRVTTVLRKPYGAETLLRAVHDALGKRELVS